MNQKDTENLLAELNDLECYEVGGTKYRFKTPDLLRDFTVEFFVPTALMGTETGNTFREIETALADFRVSTERPIQAFLEEWTRVLVSSLRPPRRTKQKLRYRKPRKSMLRNPVKKKAR